MNRKNQVFLEIVSGLHSFLLCLGTYTLIAGLCGLAGAAFLRFHVVGTLLLFPVFLSRMLLVKIRNMILYLLSGVLVSVAVGCAASFVGGLWLGTGDWDGDWILGILSGVLSFFIFCVHTHAKITYGRTKRNFQAMPGGTGHFTLREWEIPTIFSVPAPSHWIWFTLLYLCGLFLHRPACLRVIFYMVLVDVFLYFLYHYHYEFYQYVRENQSIANLPVRTMGRIHKVIGGMAILALAFAVLPAAWYGKEPLENVRFERGTSVGQESLRPEEEKEKAAEEPMAPMELPEEAEPFVIPKWIRQIAGLGILLVMVSAVFCLLRILYRAIQNAGALFAVEEEDEILFLNAVDENKSFGESRAKPEREGWLSQNARIRRRYKRQIQKHTIGRPSAWATPSELERQAGLEGTEEMRKLHEQYEEVRYGGER